MRDEDIAKAVLRGAPGVASAFQEWLNQEGDRHTDPNVVALATARILGACLAMTIKVAIKENEYDPAIADVCQLIALHAKLTEVIVEDQYPEPKGYAWVVGYSLDLVDTIAVSEWQWVRGIEIKTGRRYWTDHEGRRVYYAVTPDRLKGLNEGTVVYLSRLFGDGHGTGEDVAEERSREAIKIARAGGLRVVDAYPIPPWINTGVSS